MRDLDLILQAYEASGGDPDLLKNDRVARLVISGNEVIGLNEIQGISMQAEPLEDGVRVRLEVAPGVQMPMVAAGTSNDAIQVARDLAPDWTDEETL